MRIENLRSEKKGNISSVAATIIWEDCDRPAQEIYFGTDEAFTDGFTCNPHTFLNACIVPALQHGEERIFIDAEICPELREGLMMVMAWLRQWYNIEHPPVRIEAGTKSTIVTTRSNSRTGFFFSGGIDSLAALRTNRFYYPMSHPGSIKDGFIVYGLEIQEPQNFDHVMNSLSELAQEAQINLIPVYTNVRSLDEDWAFWRLKFEAGAFSAIAHAFTPRLSMVLVAATFDVSNIVAGGSHPLLDPNYGSFDLRIQHVGVMQSRLAKTKIVADWPVGLQHIRVCNRTERIQAGMLNCGYCEKCVRTMLALLALGVLRQTRAFPAKDLSADLVLDAVFIRSGYMESLYQELLPPLAQQGRYDLVRAIERKIAIFHDREPGLRAMIRRFDRKYLNSHLTCLKRKLYSGSAAR